jgi:hypothetical protein
MENWQFLLVVVPLLAGEIALFELTGQSWRSYWPVVAFTLYIPLNFMFMCNIFLAGAHREAAWICGVVITCLSSLLVFGELRLEWVLAGCVVLTVAICLIARRDPYSYYRKGLRYLDDEGEPAKGLLWLQRAHRAVPEETRYLYHLGRANLETGDEETGARLIEKALHTDPAFLDRLRTDPLFDERWIPAGLATASPGG